MPQHNNYKIILASQSPRRRELLKSLLKKNNFIIIVPKIDENNTNTKKPQNYALELAYKKALTVSKKLHGNFIVIAADTIVVLKNKILNKPKNKLDAFKMLKTLSGKTHTVITAYVIINLKENKIIKRICKSKVTFKKLNNNEIINYIKTKEPFDKAGAYAVQGYGAYFVKSISGSYTNVVGLPLTELFEDLKKLKIKI